MGSQAGWLRRQAPGVGHEAIKTYSKISTLDLSEAIRAYNNISTLQIGLSEATKPYSNILTL